MDQVQNGLPVFGARTVVHMNAQGITGVTGVFVPDASTVSAAPAQSEAAAKAFALAAAKKHNRTAPNLSVEAISLQYFNAGLLKGVAGETRLAYLVVVRGPAAANALPVREQIFVDAQSGVVLERINLIHTVLNRITYAGDYGANGVVVHREGNPLGTVPASPDPAFTPNNGDLFDAQPQTASSRHTYSATDVLHLYAGGT
jgi:Zn-dependent metalloprotease